MLLPGADPPPRSVEQQPQQGVIEEARRRQRRRRRWALATLAAGLAAAILIVIAGGDGRRDSASARAHAAPSAGGAGRAHAGTQFGGFNLTPALQGGSYGWCVNVAGGSMCGGVPTRAASVLGEFIEERPTLQKEIFLLLTTRKVVSVRASGRHGVHVVPLAARLAYHLHLALVTIATRHARIPHASGEPPAPAHVNRPQSLVALDVRGRAVGPALRYIEPENSPRVPTGFWQRPETPPSGPCRLRQGSLAGLAAQWGHVALALGAYPRPILGSAFFSCLDAEYYVRGWPLDVAILLDAAHPGSPPAPIPGAQPIKGVPGYFDVPGDLQGARTATRRGEAWLVAEGGRGVRQRVEVLRDLTAFVR